MQLQSVKPWHCCGSALVFLELELKRIEMMPSPGLETSNLKR